MKRIIFFLSTILSVVILTSCNDDDSFSSSKSNLLSFSADTVYMDTVFSKVPSSTRTFWVHNNSSDGIRISSIKLAQGNQTGFRVNVDGTDITATGYQTNNVDIRKGDSIRVFVELTSNSTNETAPQKLEDNLVFTLESGNTQKVNLNAWTWDAISMKNHEFKKDTTISSSKPIVVYGGLKVDSGVTVRIQGGTAIYFHDGAGISVYGTLKSVGDSTAFVTMRGDRLDNMFDYLPYDMVSGQWKGLHFYSSSQDNEIRFTDIHSANDGIVCDSSSVNGIKLDLSNSIIHNCKGAGLYSYLCQINISNCQITNTLGDCVAVYGGKATINNTTMAQFYPFDAERGVALRFSNTYNSFAYPLTLISVVNSIITGYADDELQGSKSDTGGDFNYLFDHCLICTPKNEKDSMMTHIIWESPDSTVAQNKNFRKIDTENLRYDFRLDSLSKAINAGNVNTSLEIDLKGKKRDKTPDMGCYEY